MRWLVVVGLVGCDGNPVKPCVGEYLGVYEGNSTGFLLGTLRRASLPTNRIRGVFEMSMRPDDPEEREITLQGWVKKLGTAYLDDPDGGAILYSGMVFQGSMDFDTCEVSGDWQNKGAFEGLGRSDGMWIIGPP